MLLWYVWTFKIKWELIYCEAYFKKFLKLNKEIFKYISFWTKALKFKNFLWYKWFYFEKNELNKWKANKNRKKLCNKNNCASVTTIFSQGFSLNSNSKLESAKNKGSYFSWNNGGIFWKKIKLYFIDFNFFYTLKYSKISYIIFDFKSN